MTEKDIKELFGYNLKRLRKDRKISQMDVANQLDMHFTFISDIETGKKWVSPETIAKLSSLFNVGPHEFLMPQGFKIEENPRLESFAKDLDHALFTLKSRYNLKTEMSDCGKK